jgi:bacterioferritin-associated ferredoxin
MSTGTASDEVTDMIAHIEMHRQEKQKEAGLAAACGEALRKLHELLDRERAALQLHVPGTAHSANIEAVTIEVKRVKQLADATGQRSPTVNARRWQQKQTSRPGGPRNPARNKGRRTMGRRGDR